MPFASQNMLHCSELCKRTVTGLLWITVVFSLLLFFPPIAFSFFLVVCAFYISLYELPKLATMPSLLYWVLLIFWICIPFSLLILLNHSSNNYSLFLLFLTACSNDTGAYIGGKLFGKHLLAPRISPRKTWEGFIGGYSATITAFLLFNRFEHLADSYAQIIIFAFLASGAATAGDFFESFLKRRAHLKDVSSLLPGHGGLLDRYDSILFLSYFFSLFYYA
jgi:phosphatidate cytidylyltransferase